MKIFSVLFAFLALSGFDLSLPLSKLAILNPMGEVASQEKNLIITAVCLMLIVIIPAIVMTLIFAYKYRASNKKSKYQPNWEHNTALEVVWWTIPCVIIAFLATITWITTHKLDPYRKLDSTAKPIEIQVVALDWKWLFIYPEQNIATINFIQFPINVPVNFSITADAPMNSFAIPQLGGQIYAMQGMTTKLHLISENLGEFNGFSSNYSGEGFSGMKFVAKATSQDEFNAWVSSTKKLQNNLDMAQYNKIIAPSKNNKVEYFSAVQPNLFGDILGKFMIHSGESHESHEKHNHTQHN